MIREEAEAKLIKHCLGIASGAEDRQACVARLVASLEQAHHEARHGARFLTETAEMVRDSLVGRSFTSSDLAPLTSWISERDDRH